MRIVFCYTFALAFKKCALRFLFSGFVLWKDLHIQRSSTRSVCRIFDVGRWVKETSYHFSWFWCFELDTSDEGSEQRQMECVASLVMVWVFLYLYDECLWLHFPYMFFLQWRVWSWLRMNASYRLNTCKSRGNGIMCLHILDVDRRTGEYRVSNLPSTRGYPVERRPNTRCCPHMASDVDQRFIGGGWGCVWLACWCG